MAYYATPPKPARPVHLAGAWRTKYTSPDFVGGALMFRPDDFVAANGYPNDCWGWGLEDEELMCRVRELGWRVVRPPDGVGSYEDVDPVNLQNIVYSDERGYYHEWWNMDMENGKCEPAVYGPLNWAKWKDVEFLSRKRIPWRERGLRDIGAKHELVARTEEFGGRVIRLLLQLGDTDENKHAVTALVSSKQCLRAAASAQLMGNVGKAAKAQSVKLIEMGNGKKVLPPPEQCKHAMLTDSGKGAKPRGRRQIGAPPPVR